MRLPLFLAFGLITICNTDAQTYEEYTRTLTHNINYDWLDQLSKEVTGTRLDWKSVTAPGFAKELQNRRLQSELAKGWTFYPVDTTGNIGEGIATQLPNVFEDERSYKAGWYVLKFDLDKHVDESYLLKLDRVQLFSQVYLNGKKCRQHAGAYTPFDTDLTSTLLKGENVLAIFVYDQSAAVDGDKAYNQIAVTRLRSVYNPDAKINMLPGGIHEIPILQKQKAIHLQDVFVKTSTRNKRLEIQYELADGAMNAEDLTVSFELYKWPNGALVDLEIPEVIIKKPLAKINNIAVDWGNPDLWSPDSPSLYVLKTQLKSKVGIDVVETRFGFREFWVDGKQFMLNGSPIRLRGESYYYPALHGRDFHRELLKTNKKLFGSNARRLHAFMPPGDVVLGADEAGVLLIDQSSIWSENASYYKNGGEQFLANTAIEFEEWVKRDRNSPSVVIWDVENEMLRVSYEKHLPWVEKLPAFIEKYDTTRPFNNSGQGWFSEDQDMVLLHMQEHYTKIISDWSKHGNKPLINGEFWVGGRMEQRLPNSPEFEKAYERFENEAKTYEEQMLEMRYYGVSGIMPFRIAALVYGNYRSADSYSFEAPDKLTITRNPGNIVPKIRKGLQPITLFFWQRQQYALAGEKFQKELVLCNDGEQSKEFVIEWYWEGQSGKSRTVTLKPAEILKFDVELPAQNSTSNLIATVKSEGKLIDTDTLLINPINIPAVSERAMLKVYNDEQFATFLQTKGYQAENSTIVPKVSENEVLVIPEHANNRQLNAIKTELLSYVETGGNILCLKQDQLPIWFPIRFHYWSSNQTAPHTYANMGWSGLNKHLFFATEAPIYAESHPIFDGISSKALHVWDTFDGRVSDDVFSRPSLLGQFQQGNWRPLAGGTRREHVSLAEIKFGKGKLIACQLHVIDNIENLQARLLLTNMVNYLALTERNALSGKIKLNGAVSAETFANQTGCSENSLANASAKKGQLMIASKGANIDEIKQWASEGGAVLVLSPMVSVQLGAKVKYDENLEYQATKVGKHDLLHGVSSSCFMNLNRPLIQGVFASLPENCTTILQGFETLKSNGTSKRTNLLDVKDGGPVIVSMPYGNGEILLSTLELENEVEVATQELLSVILTNCNVAIPFKQSKDIKISIKKSVPISIDGNLIEWMNDMEDRYVTQYIHAQPIYLTSDNIIAGPPEFDLNLSAINYLMYNEDALFLSGVIFSEEKTFESGVHLGHPKVYEMAINLNDDKIVIKGDGDQISVAVNDKLPTDVSIASGEIDANDMTDATQLQFNYILKSGAIATVSGLKGATFELSIPWSQLSFSKEDNVIESLFSISSRDATLQNPLSAMGENKANWLQLYFK